MTKPYDDGEKLWLDWETVPDLLRGAQIKLGLSVEDGQVAITSLTANHSNCTSREAHWRDSLMASRADLLTEITPGVITALATDEFVIGQLAPSPRGQAILDAARRQYSELTELQPYRQAVSSNAVVTLQEAFRRLGGSRFRLPVPAV
ncbi:MAG TPA: hypothetical protein VHB73_05205 [Alphaproteobacteria bacterium]|nr:hypothetical protein [Alphaproteobacteria bacterium]